VNHWTEEAAQVDNTNLNKTNWGVLQVENSSNFALHSSFWTHLSGGLNHQVLRFCKGEILRIIID